MTVPRLTRRGMVLLPLAVVWVVTGLRLLLLPDATPGFTLPIEHLPMPGRVALWWATAAVAVVLAWVPAWTTWGYVALVIPAGFRFLSYGGAVVLGDVSPLLILDVVVWAAITALIVTLARVVEDCDAPDDDTDGC